GRRCQQAGSPRRGRESLSGSRPASGTAEPGGERGFERSSQTRFAYGTARKARTGREGAGIVVRSDSFGRGPSGEFRRKIAAGKRGADGSFTGAGVQPGGEVSQWIEVSIDSGQGCTGRYVGVDPGEGQIGKNRCSRSGLHDHLRNEGTGRDFVHAAVLAQG